MDDAQNDPKVEPGQDSALTTLSNGAVYDRSIGRIVQGQKLEHDQASSMAKARWDKHRAALAAGAMRGAKVDSSEAVVSSIMEVVTDKALTKHDRDQLKAAELVLAKLAPDKEQVANPLEGLAFAASKDGLDTLLAILEAAKELRQASGDDRLLEPPPPSL